MILAEKVNSPLVTIFCPSYNHENYIEQALNSFLQQVTNFEIEILVVDDKSMDLTVSIIEKYVDLYPKKIQAIYQQENQYSKGKGLFREFCLPHAKGKYIAICDGDDYWIDPLKLQKQIDFLEQNPEFVGCSHNTKVLYEDPTCKETLIVQNPIKDIFTIEDFSKGEIYFHTSSMVYRNDKSTKHAYEFIKKHRGDWFISLAFTQYGPIKYLDEVMSVYRVHSEGMWSLLSKDEQIAKNLKAIIDFNRIFSYKYEENFLNLFIRISKQFLENKDLDFLSDIEQDDFIKIMKYSYKYIHEKEQIIQEKEQRILEQEQYIHKLHSSKNYKIVKFLKKILNFLQNEKG